MHESSSKALDTLLSRAPVQPAVYTEGIVAQGGLDTEKKEDLFKAILFRVEGEWFALTTKVFVLVTTLKKIHRLPLRKVGPVLGLVNIDGQLRIAASLKELLGLTTDEEPQSLQKRVYPRSIVIEKNGETWVFPVNEVWGIESFSTSDLENVPLNAAVKGSQFLIRVAKWRGIRLGVIDDELLFYSLKRQI